MVDGATLEMLCTATYRRFESCPLRQNPKIPHFMRDFLCFGGEDRDEEVPCCSRVGSADIRRGSHACVGNGVILSDGNEKALLYLFVPHFMRDFLCFGGEDRDKGVPCGSRVGGKPTYAEGLPLAWETALSCPFLNKNILGTSPPCILCGIFCVLAERTERKGFLVVRVPEGCLQPEEIRRESGRKQKNEA